MRSRGRLPFAVPTPHRSVERGPTPKDQTVDLPLARSSGLFHPDSILGAIPFRGLFTSSAGHLSAGLPFFPFGRPNHSPPRIRLWTGRHLTMSGQMGARSPLGSTRSGVLASFGSGRRQRSPRCVPGSCPPGRWRGDQAASRRCPPFGLPVPRRPVQVLDSTRRPRFHALGFKGLGPGRARVPGATSLPLAKAAPLLGFLLSRVFTARTLPRISPLAPLSLLAVPHRPMPEPQGVDRSRRDGWPQDWLPESALARPSLLSFLPSCPSHGALAASSPSDANRTNPKSPMLAGGWLSGHR
jgi:hypothetical protein